LRAVHKPPVHSMLATFPAGTASIWRTAHDPRSAACAISAVQFYNPKVWSNSSSGIASNTPSGAVSCCPFSASGSERAAAIDGAVVGHLSCAISFATVPWQTGERKRPPRISGEPDQPVHLREHSSRLPSTATSYGMLVHNMNIEP